MTFHQGYVAQGQVAPWRVQGVRRAGVRRSRSAAGRVRLSARLVFAVVLESLVLAGVLQLSTGLGYAGLAGALPAPAPTPSHAAGPAPAAWSTGPAVQSATEASETLPGPLQPPVPAP